MRNFIFITLSLFICTPTRADLSTLLSSPQGGITSPVWNAAITSYMSQCSGGNCPCVLVVAEGIPGQNSSARMWIGTFKGAMATELWSGYASRLANSNQNNESVSKNTDLCKRRNGVATMEHGMACIPGRRCRDPSVYRSLADDLGLPQDVALTSFYFSTPLQNEMYKFHDFYACQAPPCPRTLGCLGLERHAMKSLCLNYMGSDGSNGINTPAHGGVWLYFHNINAPSQNVGSEGAAQQGFEKFEKAGLCSNIPTANLSSGEIVSGTDFSGDGSRSNSTSGQTSSSGGSASNNMQLMQGTTDIINQRLQQQQKSEADASEEQKKIQQAVEQQKQNTTEHCIKTTTEACPNIETSTISQWCDDPKESERNGCKFNLGEH